MANMRASAAVVVYVPVVARDYRADDCQRVACPDPIERCRIACSSEEPLRFGVASGVAAMLSKSTSVLAGCALIVLINISGTGIHAEDGIKQFQLSLTHRMRIETTDRAVGLDADGNSGSSYLRNRTSIKAKTFPASNLEVTAQLTNEFRYYFVPEDIDFSLHEGFVDLLYAKWDSAANLPLSLSIGRQILSFGEGFVVIDGTPLDGSRSIYFNAARADWTFAPGHSVSLAYVNQPVKDKYLPLIHAQDVKLIEQPQQALIVYYTRSWGKSNVQAYFIHKESEQTADYSDARQVDCPGFRLQLPLTARATLVGEGAYQIGTNGASDQQGYGGYGYAEYATGWPIYLPKTVSIGGVYLSGDDPATDDDEGWEPLFGRWPKWSDSYIYTLIRERSVAYWTNLTSVFIRTTVPVATDLVLSLDYHHLAAPEMSDPAKSFPGGSGTHRGDLLIGRLTHQMSPHLSGHVLFERFAPGDFYFTGADSYGWMRTEVMLRF